MNIRYLLGIICILCRFQAIAQEKTDTVKLNEFEIRSEHSGPLIALPLLKPDTLFLNNEKNENLNQILNRQSGVFVKEYSPGGLVSISHRGYSTSQTLILWNGFPVQALTLGQADLNAIAPHRSAQTNWLGGSFSLIETSGGLASIILIDDIDLRKNELSLSVSHQFIGNSSASLHAATKLKNYSVFVSANHQNGQNNYSFRDNSFNFQNQAGCITKRINADYCFDDFRIGIFHHREKSNYKISLWYSQNTSQLPAPLLSVQKENNAKQYSKAFRALASGKFRLNQNSYFNASLYFSADSFRYSSVQPVEHSVNMSILSGAKIQYVINREGWELQLGVQPLIALVKSDNYKETRQIAQNDFQFKLSKQKKQDFIYISAFLLSKESFRPSYSAGLGWWHTYEIKNRPIRWQYGVGLARNIRYPSFNDLYWSPGGNPELKPEENLAFDLWSKITISKKNVEFSINAAPFVSAGNNFIRWIPDTIGLLWHAENVKNTQQYGADIQGEFLYKFNQNAFRITTSFNYSKAYDISQKPYKELIYVPVIKATCKPEIRIGKFEIYYLFTYIGKRYTNAANTRYMPYIYIHDAGFVYKFERKKMTIIPGLNINNIANADYQYIAWYPMPKRFFGLSLKFYFHE